MQQLKQTLTITMTPLSLEVPTQELGTITLVVAQSLTIPNIDDNWTVSVLYGKT